MGSVSLVPRPLRSRGVGWGTCSSLCCQGSTDPWQPYIDAQGPCTDAQGSLSASGYKAAMRRNPGPGSPSSESRAGSGTPMIWDVRDSPQVPGLTPVRSRELPAAAQDGPSSVQFLASPQTRWSQPDSPSTACSMYLPVSIVGKRALYVQNQTHDLPPQASSSSVVPGSVLGDLPMVTCSCGDMAVSPRQPSSARSAPLPFLCRHPRSGSLGRLACLSSKALRAGCSLTE